MKRKALTIGVFAASLLLSQSESADARPGGGSSFGGSRSSGGGSRSSSGSSGSRSSSSSWGSGSRSSGSGSSRSSSGSSGSRSYSTPTPAPVHIPVWAVCITPTKFERQTDRPGASIFDAAKPHAPIAIAADTISKGEKTASALVGVGLFGFIATIIAVPIALIGAFVRWVRSQNGSDKSWSTSPQMSGGSHSFSAQNQESPGEVRRRMDQIRSMDPDFSFTILEDFLAALYTEAHAARGTHTVDLYSPYLRPGARQTLQTLPHVAVSTIIVGALRPVAFSRDERARLHRIVYEIEANYTETLPGKAPQSYYALDRFTLVRAYGARSRPPAKARALVCPNCGAPLQKTIQGRCTYCTQAVDSGQFDWVVESIELGERETRGPMLTGTTEEVGTESPTVFDPGLSIQQANLKRADPTLDMEATQKRVHEIFATMQVAWSSLEWKRARPCLTDRLWSAQTYWIEAYRQQGLRNITENARIKKLEVVRASVDKWYLAITVRIHASSLDYTIESASNRVVGGSKTKERPYTEYWTLLRSHQKPTPDGNAPCMQCGAPTNLQMAERCAHCGTLIEASTFDWVLSRIEQDEVYGG